MATQVAGSSSPSPDDSSGERLPAVFIGIMLIEALVIAGLYWFGVHFS